MILGIDPGTGGAVAILDRNGELIEVYDLPVLDDGTKGRKTLNAPLLSALIYKTHAKQAFCELVTARPTDGVVGAFGFGRSRGVIEGCLAGAGIPVHMLTPPTWKRAAGIAPGKENKDSARAAAISHWPAKADYFARKGDVDRAEAALIGLVGFMLEGLK